TDIDVEIIPKGTGLLLVPVGYESNIGSNGRAILNKEYLDNYTTSVLNTIYWQTSGTTIVSSPTITGNPIFKGTGITDSTRSIRVTNSADSVLFTVFDDGKVRLGHQSIGPYLYPTSDGSSIDLASGRGLR